MIIKMALKELEIRNVIMSCKRIIYVYSFAAHYYISDRSQFYINDGN